MHNNPNNKNRGLRRRNTSCHFLRRRNILRNHQLHMKSNPYVGWFRHSPSIQKWNRWKESSFEINSKKSLYNNNVGHYYNYLPGPEKNNNKNSSSSPADSSLWLTERFLERLLLDLIPSTNELPVVVMDGRLVGGSPVEELSLRDALLRGSVQTESATVKILSRLALWMLFPDSKKKKKKLCSSLSSNDDDDAAGTDQGSEASLLSDDDDYDDYDLDGIVHRHHRDDDSINDVPLQEDNNVTVPQEENNNDLSVSSIAEAYYAHQAAAEIQSSMLLEEDEPQERIMNHRDMDDSSSSSRLDRVITQMDIARMARNASRHLDVESILSLPTLTFESKKKKIQQQQELDGAWSWTLIPPEQEQQEEHHDDDDICVICLEAFENGDRLRVLPCGHSFHVGCIDRWLSGSRSDSECHTTGCPTCKKRPDGSVPSWAFARVGSALAREN